MLTRSVIGLCIVVLLHLPVQTREQQPGTDSAPQVRAALSSTDVFLKLAETVGQNEPAKRLAEYQRRSERAAQKRYWAIVDFNQSSNSKRFYLFDTKEKRVDTYYVAHGKGSEGPNDDGMAELFSNVDGSSSSSLGIYRSLDEYVGQHGRSMRLEGLEESNSRALDRAIVFHTADYATDNFIRQTGRLGRSNGCFAFDPSVGNLLIDKLKNGAYIIAWKR